VCSDSEPPNTLVEEQKVEMWKKDYTNLTTTNNKLTKNYNKTVSDYNVLKQKYTEYEGSSDEETWNEGPYDQTLYKRPRGKERKEIAKQFYDSVNPHHGVRVKVKACCQLLNLTITNHFILWDK